MIFPKPSIQSATVYYLINSYLTNRKQYTEIKGIKSNLLDVTCRVPQGSILGPLLFLIYINDLHNSTVLNVLTFADDTTAYLSHHNLQILFTTVNRELDKMYNWFCTNKLSLNLTKTHYSLFSPSYKNIPDELSLCVNNVKIERVHQHGTVKSIKFLGIHIDEQLTWKNHINILKRKLALSIFAINKIKNILPIPLLKTLYFSIFYCHLIYGILAWGNSIYAKPLFNLQKRAIRVINRKGYRSHTDPLFRKDNLLKFKDLYETHALVFMKDFKLGKLPISFHHFLDQNRSRATRQANNNFNRTNARTKFSSLLPCHNFAKLWNAQNQNIKEIVTRNAFKKTIISQYISQYSNTLTYRCENPICTECQ